MAVNTNLSPVTVPTGGTVYDPYYSSATSPYNLMGYSVGQNPYLFGSVPPSPGSILVNQQAQAGELRNQLLEQLLNQGGGIAGLLGLGTSGTSGSTDTSGFLNLFNLARERAMQGLQDQFTMAGGASSLTGPFEAASANLQKGLGQTEQGNIVDLYSRLLQPRLQLTGGLLQGLLSG